VTFCSPTSQNLEGRLQGQDASAPGLTPRGHAQAAALGAALAERWAERQAGGPPPPRPPALFSSDLARAVETADAVAHALRLPGPAILDAAFRERHLGTLHGRRRVDLRAARAAGDAQARASLCALAAGAPLPGGGEGAAAVRARVAAGLGRAARVAGPGGVAIIISHGGAVAQAHWLAAGRAPGGSGGRVPNAALCRLLASAPSAGGPPLIIALAEDGVVGGRVVRPAWADAGHLARVGGGGEGGGGAAGG